MIGRKDMGGLGRIVEGFDAEMEASRRWAENQNGQTYGVVDRILDSRFIGTRMVGVAAVISGALLLRGLEITKEYLSKENNGS